MRRLSFQFALLSAVFVVCFTVSQDIVNANLINVDVKRTVDLTTHIVKISSSITIENTGKSAENYFIYAVDVALSESLSYIGALIKSSGEDDEKLKVAETTITGQKNAKFYHVEFPNRLDTGAKITVDVETVFANALRPYPAQITQAEKQFMLFTGNVYYYSPYSTTEQTTTINCFSSTIESYTKTKPVVTAENTITYGPYEKKEPFSQGDMVIHYENNSPFLTVTEMSRLVEVSHWGNVAVEETFDVRHAGAKLKGSFSRFDYQRHQDGAAAIKTFKTLLPASARDVYYRDEIGNISTSNLREMDDQMELELRPRFPLFGGWKTHYYIGYNVPSYQYLYNQGDKYVLKMRFVDHVYDDQIIEHMTLKVILPEGARDIKLITPYTVNRGRNSLHYTYLDTVGRPVIVASKDNLVEQHIQDFEIHYTFTKLMLLQEPLLVVAAFYLLFVIVIVYVRLDFSISKDEASERHMRIAGFIEEVQGVQDRRSALYQSYEDAVNKFKINKTPTSFLANRKKIDSNHKQLTQQMATLLGKLKAENSDAADKVTELQHLDQQVREQINLANQWAEKLVAGKVSKQQYLDTEATIHVKNAGLLQKAEDILASF
ncbi:Dolichyl-diphosphooligosaccharide--protein glycosyltransferase subunit 1 [Lamellibrachia satsuma]|nr:Dolichyl-diphosphooligosaccharide--protein glycosyltransferase subunit 1 [Lamellibrachia satsuma]